MAKDLEYYLAQARRIAEHREAGAEREIRKLYKSMLTDLQQFMSETYLQYAQDDKLTYAMLQAAGYNARFLEEIEARLNLTTPKAHAALRDLVEQTYDAAYRSMVDGVAKAAGGLDAVFADSIAITPEQIKNAVSNPFMELALEKNRKDIIYEIKRAVSTGLMNGDRYTTMAHRITSLLDGERSPYKSAVRIARTETHRVWEAGSHEAALRIDDELQKGTSGLRMTKEWRTMQDERVRPQRRRKRKGGWSTTMGKGPNHMILNGQTVLEGEEFDLQDGNTAMTPGQSGIAGHDINCRCRASHKLMDDAEFYAKTGKHFPGVENMQESDDPAAKYTRDLDCELAQKFGNDYYDELHERVVNSPDQNLSAVWKMYESDIEVGDASYTGHEYCIGRRIYVNGARDAKGNSFQTPYQVTFHESGHAIDSLAKKDYTGNSNPYAMHYSSAYKNGLFPQTIKDEVDGIVKAKGDELRALFKQHAGDVEWFYNNGFVDGFYYRQYQRGHFGIDDVIPKYRKAYAYAAVQREIKASGSRIAWGDLSDILEGATNGRIQCGIGHGKTYWKDRTYGGLADGLATEAFAEMIDSTFASPESLATIKKYLPKSYEVFCEMIENLLK